MRKIIAAVTLMIVWLITANSTPGDTVRISLPDFLDKGVEVSAELDARQQNVEMADNRYRQARNQRYLPNIELTTAHGLVPGVQSSDPDQFPGGQLYLDPDLQNDWENWGIFTQGEINALQPIFTWGGLSSAIEAARAGAQAVQHEYDAGEQEYRLRLFELYQSRLLALEMKRLLDEARNTLEQAEDQLEQMRDDGDIDFDEADIYQFRIYRQRFFTQEQEVLQSLSFVENAWEIALGEQDRTYLPEEEFLDPFEIVLEDLDHYRHRASADRPELRGLDMAREAAQAGVEASRSQRYPALFFGIQGRAAFTPNRPRQTNPFIRNTTNYLSASVGVGFRQNLNFRTVNLDIERREAQRRQVDYQKEAAKDGIHLELSETYRDVMVAESRVENIREALRISNEWLRDEQIEYDLGFGDIENLVDAVRENLELEVEYRQSVHRYNLKLAELYRKAGIPLTEL